MAQLTRLQRARRTHKRLSDQARSLAFQLQYTRGTVEMHQRLQDLADRANIVFEYARRIMADNAVKQFNDSQSEQRAAGKPTIEVFEPGRIQLLH